MKFSSSLFSGFVAVGLLGAGAQALAATETYAGTEPTSDPKALTILSTEVVEVNESAADKLRAIELFQKSVQAESPTYAPFDGLDEANVILDKVVNLGQKVWNLVEKGRPILNLEMQQATALPQGVTAWQSMEGWMAPKTSLYRMTIKNLYRMTVVDYSYRVLFIAGGSYQTKGKYLARVAVQPQSVYVAWGFNLESQAEVPAVMNIASIDSPVAGAEVDVRWKVGTVMNESRGSGSYFVTGNGDFKNSDTNR